MQRTRLPVYTLTLSLLFALCSPSFAQDRAAEQLHELMRVDSNEAILEAFIVPRCSEITECVWVETQGTEVKRARIRGEKSVGAAVALEWLIPIAGHAYAGDWKRGILPTVPRLGGLVLAIDQYESRSIGFSLSGCNDLSAFGLIAATVGSVWAYVSAAHTARDFNESLPTTASPSLKVDRDGLSLGILLTF